MLEYPEERLAIVSLLIWHSTLVTSSRLAAASSAKQGGRARGSASADRRLDRDERDLEGQVFAG